MRHQYTRAELESITQETAIYIWSVLGEISQVTFRPMKILDA